MIRAADLQQRKRGAVVGVEQTPAQKMRQDRQVEWLLAAVRAQIARYSPDDADPRFLVPVRCPACGLHLLGTGGNST